MIKKCILIVAVLSLAGCASVTQMGVEAQYGNVENYPMKAQVRFSSQEDNKNGTKLKNNLVKNNVITEKQDIALIQLPKGMMDKMIAWVVIVPEGIKLNKDDIVIAKHPGLNKYKNINDANEIASKDQIGEYISYVCSKDDDKCLSKNRDFGAILPDGTISRGKTCIYMICR